MRTARLKAPKCHDTAYYHCVSRIINRDFLLGNEEREHFVSLMRTYETLYGLRVLTYCVMSNHFHILLEVPRRPDQLPSNEELVELTRKSLGREEADKLRLRFQLAEEEGAEALERLRESYFSKMWDLSAYMKMVKQRFTQWYNKRKGRRGTLWEERFKSMLVQGKSHALKAMAAYIDLNPVRAKMMEDPKDYRWSGYGEAVGGRSGNLAQDAVRYLVEISHQEYSGGEREELSNATVLARWRRFMFGLPEDETAARRHTAQLRKDQIKALEKGGKELPMGELGLQTRVSREKVLEILENQGELSLIQACVCKVRYFIDGAALGAKSFVEEVFQANRGNFGQTRTEGARTLKGITQNASNKIYGLRDLRKEVFIVQASPQ